MPDNTFAVTIGGTDYPSYADQVTADDYLAASLTVSGWTAADAATKAKALVTATRLIDRQVWSDGYATFDQRKVVQAFVDACCELAGGFVDGSTDAIDNASTEQTTKSLKAGSVAIDYFRIDPMTATRFPTVVQELLGSYLAGNVDALAAGAGYAGGTERRSAFRHDYGLADSI